MVVIDDAEGPTSIAGLMGGARSEVRAGDDARAAGGRDLERAEHPPHLVALGLRSEASSRFEKGLQPEQCMHAQAVAARLMIELLRRDARRRARSTSAASRRRRR